MPGTFIRLLSITLFALARPLIHRGKPVGMWLHNKGILCAVAGARKEKMSLGLESLLHPSLALACGIILGLVLHQIETRWEEWRARRKEKK
jgi:hypothetical protein